MHSARAAPQGKAPDSGVNEFLFFSSRLFNESKQASTAVCRGEDENANEIMINSK